MTIEIEVLKETPRGTGAKKLQGLENAYRVRVGDYRIIYEIFDSEQKVVLSDCGHRSSIY